MPWKAKWGNKYAKPRHTRLERKNLDTIRVELENQLRDMTMLLEAAYNLIGEYETDPIRVELRNKIKKYLPWKL